jgi:hypothetical protein
MKYKKLTIEIVDNLKEKRPTTTLSKANSALEFVQSDSKRSRGFVGQM